MGKKKKQHIRLKLQTIISAFVKYLYVVLIPLLLPIMIEVYHLGSDNMAAQKDREIASIKEEHTSKIIDSERQHREETNNLAKERDEWKDKYFSTCSRERTTNKGP